MVLLGIAGVSLAAWVWLLLGQGGFWRTDVRLPPGAGGTPPEWPSVAVVVPARDEAEVLGVSLPSLLAQAYPGRAEVFLVDDGSSDGTGELAGELGAAHGGGALVGALPILGVVDELGGRDAGEGDDEENDGADELA